MSNPTQESKNRIRSILFRRPAAEPIDLNGEKCELRPPSAEQVLRLTPGVDGASPDGKKLTITMSASANVYAGLNLVFENLYVAGTSERVFGETDRADFFTTAGVPPELVDLARKAFGMLTLKGADELGKGSKKTESSSTPAASPESSATPASPS